ncbi:hypothetical protein J4219_06140 [Candidatus Woesearchaeota archaeon]|nr:hypothetical protein [Candidatus Woesearchaeota archaeon]
MKHASHNLKLAAAIYETVLALPFFGGFIILSLQWSPLAVSLILGVVGLAYSHKEHKNNTGHIVQMMAGALGWIPLVGWVLHFAAALVLWISWALD